MASRRTNKSRLAATLLFSGLGGTRVNDGRSMRLPRDNARRRGLGDVVAEPEDSKDKGEAIMLASGTRAYDVVKENSSAQALRQTLMSRHCFDVPLDSRLKSSWHISRRSLRLASRRLDHQGML